LLRLGWSYKDKEIFSLEESIKYFNLSAIGKSPSKLDMDRILSMNEHYIKNMDEKELFQTFKNYCQQYKVKIKSKLKNKFTTTEDILITRERHRQNLINCVKHLEKFRKKKSSQDFDKAAEDLRLATRHLGMIVGKVDVEELLGSIFNDFCIGK